MTKKKKTSREKRALIGAVCTAAVILAGSTFAWYTSTDTVTNRLSANAEYNVSAVETFTPPTNWTPGQEVNKDVYALNTGNIPAFVKQKIAGVLTVTTESAGDATYVTSGSVTVPTTTGVVLSKVKGSTTDTTGVVTKTVNEVAPIQAGAVIAYSPTASEIGLTTVAVDENGDPSTDAGNADKADFKPKTTGLYVFRHTISVDSSTKVETFKYAAYYYVAASGDTGGQGTYYKVIIDSNAQTALSNASNGVTKNENGTLVKWSDTELGAFTTTTTPTNSAATTANSAIDTALAGIKFATESTTVVTPKLTYQAEAGTDGSYVSTTAYSDTNHPARLKATSTVGTKTIDIYINLATANVDTNNADAAVASKWQLNPASLSDATEANFYYTSLLGAGENSTQLIDSVILSSATTGEEFKSFDFDLNVTVDSAQAIYDTDNTKIKIDAVTANTTTFNSKTPDDAITKSSDGVIATATTAFNWFD